MKIEEKVCQKNSWSKSEIVLKKLIKIRLMTISYSLIGDIKRLVKFLTKFPQGMTLLTQLSSNKMSHKTTADKIIFSALHTPNELFEIKKFVKKPQNRI